MYILIVNIFIGLLITLEFTECNWGGHGRHKGGGNNFNAGHNQHGHGYGPHTCAAARQKQQQQASGGGRRGSIHPNTYQGWPSEFGGFNNNAYFQNPSYKENSQQEVPAVRFTQVLNETNCPRPVLGDQGKFELRCIHPIEDEDIDCYSLGLMIASGTTAILRCKEPYVNENGEIRIWVCEDGAWKGEFKSIVCMQGSHTFNFKNQTKDDILTPLSHHLNKNNKGSHSNNHRTSGNLSWSQKSHPTPSIDERKKAPAKHQHSQNENFNNENKIVNNLFPNLLEENGAVDENLPETFSSWTEPVSPLQPPWFNTFDRWKQQQSTPAYPPSTTTTPATTTQRPTTTSVRPYGWIFTTTTSKPYVAPPSKQVPVDNWTNTNEYNQTDLAENNSGQTTKCPPLRKRTGVKLECLSKAQVADDESSFLVSQSDCKTPQRIGTDATYKCEEYHESTAGLALQYRKCKADGTWTNDNGFSCSLECGKSNPVGKIPLITNGEETKRADWPWHAALFFRDEGSKPNVYDYICGGTLINRKAIITAAHCVTEFYSTKVKSLTAFRIDLGRYERTVEDEYVQTFSVKEIIPHPSYNPHSFDSDIALIILSGAVTVSYFVRPVCYPQTQNSAFEALHLSDGSIGTVVGFGKNEDNVLSNLLHVARLKVVSQQECAESFTDTNYGTSLTKSTTFCAGLKNGTNVCSGDSGGGIYFPLNTAGTSRWYLQGLVSVGIGSQDGTNRCDPTRYSVFTRISPYADWIVRVLSEKEAL